MLKQLSTHIIQHLLAQNEWSAPMLRPFASKAVQLNFVLFKTSLVILENGNLAIAGETNLPDATITIPPSLLLRLMAKDESAKLQIKVDGDTHLATTLAKVLSHVRWDYEDDLSKLTGDVSANKISEFTRQSVSSVKDTAINLAEMLSEYWQEEKPLLAKKRHVDQFNTEVDTLRADVERLEKRLNKLANKTNTTTAPN
ncbi:MAG TPA: SCP2 sterol-binding domain-containing protein [Methylotenera sp.]